MEKTITWVLHASAGKAMTMTMPLHPVLWAHLVAVQNTSSEVQVASKYYGLSYCALRSHFRKMVAHADLQSDFNEFAGGRRYRKIEFSSLKLAFAREVGYNELFRLSRYIHSLSKQQLQAAVSNYQL